MEGEGSAHNPDAQNVRKNCFKPEEVGLVELITPKVYSMVAAHKYFPRETF